MLYSNKTLLSLCVLLALGMFTLSNISVPPTYAFSTGAVIASVITVLTSDKARSRLSRSDSIATTLYVGNLPYKVSESHVRALFSEHGKVLSVRLMKDNKTGRRRGFGFVAMQKKDALNAIEALNQFSYLDRALKVRIADGPKGLESNKNKGGN